VIELDEADKQILAAAHATFASAQAVISFVGEYLARKYKLPTTARIMPNGRVELAPSPADGQASGDPSDIHAG